MNNKELIAKMSAKSEISVQEIEVLLEATVSAFTKELGDGKSVGVQSFGNFEVRKKEERLSVHPATKVRSMIPPKLVVYFKQSNVLKEKLKDAPRP